MDTKKGRTRKPSRKPRMARLLLVAEIEVDPDDDLDRAAQARLDAFREAVLPTENYGIVFRRATFSDMAQALVALDEEQPDLENET